MREIYKNRYCYPPFLEKGLSKSLLESASMSLPIITTNVPGCMIITNEYSGLLVPARRNENLKYAIEKYLNNQN